MSIVLDAGAFIAVERADRAMVALIKRERQASRSPLSHGGVVGQVWRDGARQVALARLLPGVDVRPLDRELGKRAGGLLAVASANDVIDAAVVVISDDGDEIYTSDPEDLAALAAAAGRHVDVIGV